MVLLHDGDQSAKVRVLLAHGAGAAMDSAFMQLVAEGLARAGLYVARFEFPYMAARRTRGERRGPDRPPVLMQAFRDAVAEFGGPKRLVVGGKSMGGRIASMVADELAVSGLVVFGYPFHPPKKPNALRTRHLLELATPALFVQGTRDEFGTREEVATYSLSSQIELSWIEDGDHSLKPRKRAGLDASQALDGAIATAAAFVKRVTGV
jgi:predicted alpha/beta-hydrolase family hydrolase